MHLGKAETETVFPICICARLSLYLPCPLSFDMLKRIKPTSSERTLVLFNVGDIDI